MKPELKRAGECMLSQGVGLPMLLGCLLCLGTGCRSIGPRTVPRDRLDYSQAIANSWKHQTLINLIRLRYRDTPIFLEVAQIVSGYTLETAVEVSGEIYERSTPGDSFLGLGATGKYTDRPTITYSPLTGDQFLSDLMRPIPINNLLGLLQAGYDSDFVLQLGISRLNGLKNAYVTGDKAHSAEPLFLRAVELLHHIQEADALEFRAGTNEVPNSAMELVFFENGISETVRSEIQEFKRLLNLDASRSRYPVVSGSRDRGDGALTVSSRSALQIMIALAGFVQVPQNEVDEGRTFASFEVVSKPEPPLRVLSGDSAPKDAFVTVRYRGHWFWVDDRDMRSKRTLSTIQLLFTLASPARQQNLPQITIPAQ